MSVIIRGIKNAVRNPGRAVSVVAMLAVAVSFALSLLLANQAVKAKIDDLKTTGDTTLSIMPAGMAEGPGQIGGGEPLTSGMFEQAKKLAHVSESGAFLGGGGIRMMKEPGGQANISAPESEIDLQSPIEAGTLGQRGLGAQQLGDEFKLPVQAAGISGTLDRMGKNYQLSDGEWFTSQSGYQAVVGKDLAEHNNLKVGSTFTGFGQTFTVIGIYDAGDTFQNASLLMPLTTYQTLSERPNEITSISLKVDSIENIESVEAAINSTLGDDKVDISSSAQSTEDAINSLKSIQRISIIGVAIATIAVGVIVFMVMANIVRERKKEIAVLKAIGGSNFKIAGQFVVEAVVLTGASVLVGAIITLASSNTLTNILVTANTNSSTETSQTNGPLMGGGLRRIGGPMNQTNQTSAKDLLKNVHTEIGTEFLIQGLLAVVAIGALGSAIPAYAISKIRPAEVLRSE